MEISTQFLVLIPVVLGLVQVVKLSGLATRWAPLTSLVLGICVAALVSGLSRIGILQGVIIGLSAAGLYSGTKTTITVPVDNTGE